MIRRARTFEIPGTPRAWRRAVGKDRRYTDPEMRAEKGRIAWLARAAGVRKIPGPVRLCVVAVFPTPATMPSARRAALAGSPVEKRPDVDNLFKLVADALNGVAYADDAQVASFEGMKIWGGEGRTLVTVRPWLAADEAVLAAAEQGEVAFA